MDVKELKNLNKIITPDNINPQALEKINGLSEEVRRVETEDKVEQTRVLGKGFESYLKKSPTKTDYSTEAEEFKKLGKIEQLQKLINIAFREDPVKAVLIAQKLESPFDIDNFHDLLLSKHKEFVKRGKLTK